MPPDIYFNALGFGYAVLGRYEDTIQEFKQVLQRSPTLAEAGLRESYVPKLSKVLPWKKVARYLQIENKIRAVVKYELATQIPLVE